TQSRKAPNAAHQCHPLSLQVTEATLIGGTRSADFITFQGDGPATVDALVDGSSKITTGTVNMSGGTPGASSSQQTVDTASARNVDIVATYTATGSTASVTSRVRI